MPAPTTFADSLARRKASCSKLEEREYWWRDHQQWLQACGYMLRPRYRPGWTPSWHDKKRSFIECEDRIPISYDNHNQLDATRVSDGKMVTLKRIVKSEYPAEVEILEFFSSDAIKDDPRNHCVPVYAVLPVPETEDTIILVQPVLRKFDDPSFKTVGEVIESIHQIIQGVQFMHEHRVTHGNIAGNVMMDPSAVYPDMYHPQSFLDDSLDMKGFAKHYSRTERPTKYYFTGFERARRFSEYPHPLVPSASGVPETQDHSSLYQQGEFRTDIDSVGIMIKVQVLLAFSGLEFLDTLVADMMEPDPAKQPNIDMVVARFDEIRKRLKGRSLRSRPVPKWREEHSLVKAWKDCRHACRMIKYAIRGYSALPTPA
ncbi:hypothetical protein B0H21DRAFT_823236 [Amylocystis lapponica]|nr:hypothetical protein B0H21DRAFT_823236 [Amylocystis lapponica]